MLEAQQGPNEGTDRRHPKRINVAVTVEAVEALQQVIDREGVSLTEAVRRLVGYGEFVYRTIKVNKSELLVKDANDVTREVVLIP